MTDRDGLYVLVSPSGGIAFKYDYRFNGRRETVTFGAYGPGGLSLAKARQKLNDAKRQNGVSPALEKQRAKRRLKAAQSFEHFALRWMDHSPMADSTRYMRRSIFNREVLPEWRNKSAPLKLQRLSSILARAIELLPKGAGQSGSDEQELLLV